jgi:hypothetical protein
MKKSVAWINRSFPRMQTALFSRPYVEGQKNIAVSRRRTPYRE